MWSVNACADATPMKLISKYQTKHRNNDVTHEH